MKIGITGTIASGKTTVSILFKRRGMPVFNCDNYSRMALHAGNPCFQALIEKFGDSLIGSDGDIDRTKLAELIFHNEENRKAVNAIIHPWVREGMLKFFDSHENDKLVFAEVPLLFEAGWLDDFDRICVVTCKKETAVRRMMEDRDYTEEEALARYDSQIDPVEQIRMADDVIWNDGSLTELDHEINLYTAKLRKEARNGSETERHIPE